MIGIRAMRGIQTKGNAIRSLRRSRGMTQEQLAAAAEIDVRTLRRAEAAQQRVDLRIVVAVADVFGVDPTTLILPSGTETPTAERLIELVQIWGDAMIRADIEAILAMHTQDTVLELPGLHDLPTARDCIGIAALEQQLRDTATFLRLLRATPGSERNHVCDNIVFMRVNGEFEFLPTGQTFSARHVNEIEFEGELIKRRVTIADYEPLRRILAELDGDLAFKLG